MTESYSQFFEAVTGYSPYPYQTRLGEAAQNDAWPDLLEVPTGLGKTAAIVVAWLWGRGHRLGGRRAAPAAGTPRRLVYCLPMRVLVEQTADNVCEWLRALGALGRPGDGKVSVHVLMGGEDDLKSWADVPEEDAVLVGTQDMLLSRALNRGYGMSRYQWPVHFALLHSDAFWVYDEVQLMGPAVATSAQLEAFRRDPSFPLGRPSRSLWASATLRTEWLATVDMRPHVANLSTLRLESADRVAQAARRRLEAHKEVRKADSRLLGASKKDVKAYLQALAEEVLAVHDPAHQTLVVLNRVDRAQGLFEELRGRRSGAPDLLIHARFRPADRRQIERRLREEPATNRIIVATQAVEAGVDVSSKVLFTELAPWASVVQRFGRCNRYGEHDDATVRWMDLAEGADPLPYESVELDAARQRLRNLPSAAPDALPAVDAERPSGLVLRRKDLLDLFSTHPDLSGFDVDVSEYIRGAGRPALQVFWRRFEDPNLPEPQARPHRDELCSVPMSAARWITEQKAWRWDTLAGQWRRLDGAPLPPGATVLLSSDAGGYDPQLGFLGAEQSKPKKGASLPSVAPVPLPGGSTAPADVETYVADWRSVASVAVPLEVHLRNVRQAARQLCQALGEQRHADAVVEAAAWHDVGKAHPVFQCAARRCEQAPADTLLAKSNCPGRLRYDVPGFRHELWSMRAWLAHHDAPPAEDPFVDLVAYLVLAHHGKLRTHLRPPPLDSASRASPRGGSEDGEQVVLPELDVAGERMPETSRFPNLEPVGLGPDGRSWLDRVQGLLRRHGPFLLAWLETLVRIADWRASAAEQAVGQDGETTLAADRRAGS